MSKTVTLATMQRQLQEVETNRQNLVARVREIRAQIEYMNRVNPNMADDPIDWREAVPDAVELAGMGLDEELNEVARYVLRPDGRIELETATP